MKKSLFLLVSLFAISSSFSQENEVRKCIDDFFIAFHLKDTTQLKKMCHEEIIMCTVSTKNKGTKLKNDSFDVFLKSIASIPSNVIFLEKLLDYKIEIDGDLAHVWTPYEFFVNEKLSYQGVNSFTLIKEYDNLWKIVYIIDTRNMKSL